MVQSTKVDMAVQLEVPKKAERSIQTQGLGGECEIQRQVLKLEVFKSEKQKVKKKKKKQPKEEPGGLSTVAEATQEDSYYEYYEEEVDEEEATLQQPIVLSTGGVPIYINTPKKV